MTEEIIATIKKHQFSTLIPLSAGQMLDRAFRLYRRNFLLLISVFAPIQIVSSMLLLFQTVDNVAIATLASVLGSLVSSVLAFLGTAALAIAVLHIQSGEKVTVGQVYSLAQEKIGILLIALIASIVAGLALTIWWVAGIIVGWISGMGMLLFFSTCVTPLIVIIVTAEDVDGFKALRRAWDLTRRRFWPTFGYTLLVTILAQIIVVGPIMLAAVAGVITFGEQSEILIYLQSLASLVVGVIYTPFQVIAYIMLYLDLRVRTEGLDIEMQAAEQAELPKSPLTVLKMAPPALQGNWLTMTEYGYFVLLSIAFLVIVFGIGLAFGVGAVALVEAFGGF